MLKYSYFVMAFILVCFFVYSYVTKFRDDKLVNENKIISVSSMNDHSVALTDTGKIFIWGYSPTDKLVFEFPTELDANFDGKVVFAAAGYSYSLALTEFGTIYTWGKNEDGWLGRGDNLSEEEQNQPTALKNNFVGRVLSVTVGGLNTFVLTSSGKVYAWGYNSDGELGLGEDGQYLDYSATPIDITEQFDEKIVKIAASRLNFIALTNSGKIYVWGANGKPFDSTDASYWFHVPPQEIDFEFDSKPVYIAAGEFTFFVVTESGSLYSWGSNYYGQLGLGDNAPERVEEPTRVMADFDSRIVAISGDFHILAVTEKGSVYSWGNVPDGSDERKSLPKKMKGKFDGKVVSVVASNAFSHAVTEKGSVYSWGKYSIGGNLGVGKGDYKIIYIDTPVKITKFKQLK